MAEIKKACTCRWKNCKRYGNCRECIEHHKRHEKYPLPYCKRKVKAEKRDKNLTVEELQNIFA
ncbi:MAG TPA: hypothetical protein PLG48_06555, partial [Candidatus Avimonas sp.]|nr:hypothetical protein [Candidatus Avimonas sp.]